MHDWGSGTSQYKYLTYLSGGSSNLVFYVRTGAGVKAAGFGGTWNDNAWHHIAGVYDRYASDGERIKLYVDGVKQSFDLGDNADISAGDQGITFGRWNTTGTVYTGWLDDVAVFDNPLTAAQVLALYTGAKTPGTVLLAEAGDGVPEPAGLGLLGLALLAGRKRRR